MFRSCFSSWDVYIPYPSQGPFGPTIVPSIGVAGFWGGFSKLFSPLFSSRKSTPFRMGFWLDFYLKMEPKSTKNHSKTALFRCFFAMCFSLFFLISAQFSRCANLRNRAGAYSTVVFSRNRRFRFRSSFSMDFCSFSPHFRCKNAPKWPPGPFREKSRLLVPIFLISGPFWGAIWPPWGDIFR